MTLVRLSLACCVLQVAVSGCSQSTKVESFPDSFVGVGLEIRMEREIAEVVRAIPGSAAADMGVEAGDIVERIDSTDTDGLSLGDIVMKIRGEPGTQVTLTVSRGPQRMIFVIPRRKMVKGGKPTDDKTGGAHYRAQSE